MLPGTIPVLIVAVNAPPLQMVYSLRAEVVLYAHQMSHIGLTSRRLRDQTKQLHHMALN